MTTSPPRPGETDPATPAPPVPDAPPAPGQVWRQIEQVAAALTANIERVIQGKHEAVGLAVAVMLAGGHLLIEDVPGVGKTMLARAIAASIQASVNRIQFTPDLLPSDITGASVYNSQTRVFEFEPGPVFANIVIGDEINRASPKTQSALLECMEEGQVTVDAQSHQLPDPFFVVATQNPIDMDGTFGLLEAQRDRFMARLQMGYPSAADEAQIVRARGTREPIDQLAPIASLELIREVVDRCRQVYVADAITDYAVAIVRGTRTDPALRLGASPRAAVQLVAVAKAFAATHGRGYVLPDDIDRLAAPVLSHRLLPATAARGQDVATHLEEVVRGIVHRVPVPVLQPGRTAPPSEGTGSAGPAAPATRRSVRGR